MIRPDCADKAVVLERYYQGRDDSWGKPLAHLARDRRC